MKKTLATILSLTLSATCLFGCGAGKDEGKKKAEADKDDVTITVWSTEAGAQATYEELVDEWNAAEGDKKNIFIDWVTTTDSKQIDVAQQNGQLPHLFNVSGSQRKKFIEQGDVLALDDLPGGKEFVEEFGQEGIEGQTLVDGKMYGVQPTVKTAGLAYNKDLFKQAGIVDEKGEAKAPKTLEEVREYAKKITELGNGIYGFAFPLKFGTGFTVSSPLSTYYNNYGEKANASVYTDLDNLTVDYSGYKEMFGWLLDMKKDGSLFPGAETLDNDTARAYFSAGTIGMIPAISWDVAVYTEQFPAECDWDICQYPGPEGKELIHHWNQRGGMRLIGRVAEKNPKETMEVIKFLYSKELRAAMFERGINLSSKRDVLDIVDESKIDPRFLKFGEFVDEEARYATGEAYAIEGDSWEALFQKVWMEEMSLDAAIKDISSRATTALKKAVSRGEYDVERQKRVRRYLNGEDGVDISMTH